MKIHSDQSKLIISQSQKIKKSKSEIISEPDNLSKATEKSSFDKNSSNNPISELSLKEMNSDLEKIKAPTAKVNILRAATTPDFLGIKGSGSLPLQHTETLKTDKDKIVKLDTKKERLESLEFISQLDNDDQTFFDNDRCGPSCLVAGALYSGGKEGLLKLIKAMNAYSDKHGIDVDTSMEDLKTKLQSGANISVGDINKLQDRLYMMLYVRQEVFLEESGIGSDGGDGLYFPTMGDFINDESSADFKNLFAENSLNIKQIDLNGSEDGGGHFILSFHQDDGNLAVYDPLSREGSDGNLDQVITDKETLIKYAKAVIM